VTRRRSDDCSSDLKLDRCLAGEVTPAEQRDIQVHLEACELCQRRHAELAESRRQFARDVPPFAALTRPAARSPRWNERSRWLVGASALAAAAAISLAIGRPWSGLTASTRDAKDPGTRTKGGLATLSWVVRRGDHVFPGRLDQPLRAGDAVRFSISARERAYIAVLGLDAAGQLDVYYPDGELLAKIEAGRDQLLPVAIELDAAPGKQQLYGVFCTSAEPLSGVRDAIQRSPDAPALPGGCSSERWALKKEAP
jgi:Domain of unknown function (DUF4384)